MRASDRWVAWAACAYTVFFLYGSLAPLRWQPQTFDHALSFFMALPDPHWPAAERVDAAVNFLLPLPLAFALAHLASSMRRRWLCWLVWGLLWPLLAGLSLSVELAQVLLPARDPSWSDVVAQWAGAAAGLLLFAACGRRFRALLAQFSGAAPALARSTQWLGVYLALLVAFSLMPLDLSISPVELYRKWRDGRVILLPFGGPARAGWEFLYALLSDVALWLPVGLLWRIDGRQRSLLAVVRRGLFAAALLELAQLAVMSRVSDVTDILLAGVGVALGAALPVWLAGCLTWDAARRQRWLGLAWCLWLAVALTVLWQPFDFDGSRLTAGALHEALTRLPFETYFQRGEFGALSEMLRKLLVFLPGGLLLAAWAAGRVRPVPGWLVMAGLAALALVLEAGQLLLPGKVADLSDAALGSLGAALGWRIARSLRAAGARTASAAAMAAAAPTLRALAATQRPPGAHSAPAATKPWPAALSAAATVGVLALLLWAGSRLPGVPYNVVKLMPADFAGAVAALGLAVAAWWMLAAPLWLLAAPRRQWRLVFALPLLAHALVTFVLLRATVPLAMIHKIIGNPVLGWGGPWEDIGRYLALHMSLMIPVFGGVLLARVVWRPQTVVDFIGWCFTSLLLAWPLHWVVVDQAGTDNLVELMRGGGSLAVSAALALALLLVTTAGSALSLALAGGQPQRRSVLLGLAAVATAAALLCLQWGLEPMLVKYGRAFSALQFLLSASRDSYATGGALLLRLALALAAGVALVTALQWAGWRRLGAEPPPPSVLRRHRRGALPAA